MRRFVAAIAMLAGLHCSAPEVPRAITPVEPPPVVTAPVEPPPVVTAPEPPPPRPGAYANVDPSDDYVVGPPEPVADCEEQLRSAGVKFTRASLPVHTEGRAKMVCGAPQVVMYLRGPAKIAYDIPPVLTCRMALALATFEKIVDEEARRVFRSPVVKIEQLGTYACRVIPRFPTLMSEHGYANAIDIGRMFLENGQTISIYRDFDRGDGDPKTKRGTFLRAISRRANDEDVFSHVLTPFFDSAHDNHFHLDLARFRRDGTRPELLDDLEARHATTEDVVSEEPIACGRNPKFSRFKPQAK